MNIIKRIWNKLFKKTDKRIFYINTGNKTPEDIAILMQKMKEEIKNHSRNK